MKNFNNLKTFEEWNWNPFKKDTPEKPKEVGVKEDADREWKEAGENLITISLENEKLPEFIDIKNKIENGEFIKCKRIGPTWPGVIKFKLNDNRVISIFMGLSCGPGWDGWERNDGKEFLVCHLYIDKEPLGKGNDQYGKNTGYITGNSYNELASIADEFISNDDF